MAPYYYALPDPLPYRFLPDVDLTVLEKVLDTNLIGPFLVAQAVARSMVRDKRKGNIINISSVSSIVPSAGERLLSSALVARSRIQAS